MNNKYTKPFTALVFTTQTTLPQLGAHVGHVAQDLYREAAALNLLPTGPIHWNYVGVDGKPDTVFTLDIVLPVQGQEVTSDRFAFQTILPFKCISLVHEGPWEELPQVYGKAMSFIHSQGLQLSGANRELYLMMDFENGANNVTEVQIGVL